MELHIVNCGNQYGVQDKEGCYMVSGTGKTEAIAYCEGYRDAWIEAIPDDTTRTVEIIDDSV